MEICNFFVIFYDFVMKCVYKSTIYTFVIRDKIWTPPLPSDELSGSGWV